MDYSRLDSDVPGIGLVADAEMGLFWWSRVPLQATASPGTHFFGPRNPERWRIGIELHGWLQPAMELTS